MYFRNTSAKVTNKKNKTKNKQKTKNNSTFFNVSPSGCERNSLNKYFSYCNI